jgi:putative peptide zinc metalloprotease protein
VNQPAKCDAPRRLGEIHVLHTSNVKPTYLLACDNGAQIQLSKTAKLALEMRWAGHGYEEIAKALSSGQLHTTAPEEAARYILALENKIDELERTGGGPTDPGFGFKRTLFSAARAGRIAAKLTWLYSPAALAFTLPFIFAAFVLAAYAGAGLRGSHISAATVSAGYALFLASLFAHEFGHSAACLRFGGAPGKIGLTIYLVLPALYSDVGSAWRMKRGERVVVDLGGTYFHLLVAAVYLAVWKVTGLQPFSFAAVAIGFTLLFNMNPIFKFDGYWLVADALGVTNLSLQPRKIVAALAARLRGSQPEPLPWPPATITILVLYTIASITVWAFFTWRLGIGLYHQLSTLAAVVSVAVRSGHAMTYDTARASLLAAFGIVMTAYLVSRLVLRGVTTLRSMPLSGTRRPKAGTATETR